MIFDAVKLRLLHRFLAMHLRTESRNTVAALELMCHLGVCYKLTWLIEHKPHGGHVCSRRRSPARGRQVEIDDAYLGGKCSGGKARHAKLPQLESINTFLGKLRRSLSGACHAFDFAKYAHRYLVEAQYRFNR